MSAIPEIDPEEPMETKPFKFVTGALFHTRRLSPLATTACRNGY